METWQVDSCGWDGGPCGPCGFLIAVQSVTASEETFKAARAGTESSTVCSHASRAKLSSDLSFQTNKFRIELPGQYIWFLFLEFFEAFISRYGRGNLALEPHQISIIFLETSRRQKRDIVKLSLRRHLVVLVGQLCRVRTVRMNHVIWMIWTLRWDYDSGTYRERFRLFESRAEEAKGREGTAKSGSEDSATDSKPYKKTSRD